MADENFTVKRPRLGAKFYKPKTEEELKKERASQELANRMQAKGVKDATKENSK